MNARERQDQIVRSIAQHGFVSVEALAGQFDVTPQTIRRDIGKLHEDGRVRRFHGGAAAVSTVENLAYSARQVLCHREKQAIATTAAKLVPDNASLILNIGTTTEEVAKALVRARQGLRIITNNMNVATIVQPKTDFEVYIAGGFVRSRDGGVVGEDTLGFFSQFKVDIAIIGISAIDPDDGAMLDYDYREVQVSRQIISSARAVWLVADSSKFGRQAPMRLANLTEMDRLVTDRPPPAVLVEAMRAAGRDVVVADGVRPETEQ